MESGTHSNEAIVPLVRVTFIMDGPTEGTKRKKKNKQTNKQTNLSHIPL